jgi:hypothetical protein
MAFTRDQLAAYEKGAAAAAPVVETPAPAVEPEAEQVSAEPAGDESLATDSASSAEDGASDPTDTGDDGSAVEADSAPATDPDSSATEDEQAAPASKPRTVPYDRFQEVVDERNALREFGKYLQAQNAARPPVVETAVAPEPPVAVAEDEPMPTLEQFDYDPVAHGEALKKWVRKQVSVGVQTELQTVQAKQSAAQVGAAFEARVTEFKKTHPDYDTVIKNPALPKPSQQMARAVVMSEIGPAILHHLATNPDIAVRISKMSPDDQGIAIGRIEGQLLSQPAPAPAADKGGKGKDANTGKANADTSAQPARTRTVSKAPPPPRPVSAGRSPTTRTALDPGLSMEDFVALERQKKMDQREMRQKIRSRLR